MNTPFREAAALQGNPALADGVPMHPQIQNPLADFDMGMGSFIVGFWEDVFQTETEVVNQAPRPLLSMRGRDSLFIQSASGFLGVASTGRSGGGRQLGCRLPSDRRRAKVHLGFPDIAKSP